eukprot:gene1536-1933_t
MEEKSLFEDDIIHCSKYNDRSGNTTGSSNQEDVAIIGFGLRFPGDAKNLDEFWDVLINRIDGVKDLDPERKNANYFKNEISEVGKLGFIQGWEKFDPLFFGIPPKDTPAMDPQQRLLLKTTWETFEDAGIDPLSSEIVETKFFQDFMISKIDISKPTSIWDSSFLNPPIIDTFHHEFLMTYFPQGCAFHSVNDIVCYTSNIPKTRDGYQFVYLKSGYLKLDEENEDGFETSDPKLKMFLEDGTVLFEISNIKVVPFKKVEDITTVKHPVNDLFSSFWQSKELSIQPLPTKYYENFQPTHMQYLEKNYFPLVSQALFNSINKSTPTFTKELISSSSVEEIQKQYLKDQKWRFLFQKVLQFLKDNISFINESNETEIEILLDEVKYVYPELYEYVYFHKSIPMISEILFGNTNESSAQTLVSEGIMKKLYTLPFNREFIQLLINNLLDSVNGYIERKESRIIRILEIGSGTGSLSISLLDELNQLINSKDSDIEIEFTFSDISQSFFPDAIQSIEKLNLNRKINMIYRVIDISSDLNNQNVNSGYYDFIVMLNVLHVTTDINLSLMNIFKSLIPGGQLLCVEPNKNVVLQNFFFGVLDQWWGFKDFDLRPNHCCLDQETWIKVLNANGFENSILTPPMNGSVLEQQFFITQKPKLIKILENPPSSTSPLYNQCIIYGSESSSFSIKLKEFYSSISDQVALVYSDQEFSRIEIGMNDIIIFSKGLEPLTKDNFTSVDMEYTRINQILLSKKLSTKLILLTLECHLESKNYLNASLFGIYRSFFINNMNLYSIDLDSKSLQNNNIISMIEYICNRNNFVEKEFSIRNGTLLVKNWRKDKSQIKTIQESESNCFYLDINLELQLDTLPSEIGPREIIVKTESIGLNFRDTLYSRGIVKYTGCEFSGIVTRIGKDIKNFKIGDCVVGIRPKKSRIHFRQVDVSNKEQIRESINDIYTNSKHMNGRELGTIESIFHFAFALYDCLPEDISLETFKNGHSAKTIGALNLHELSLEMKLNLKNFVLNSSSISEFGSPYQCGYISSNLVINSFSNYRKSLGLPCTNIIW